MHTDTPFLQQAGARVVAATAIVVVLLAAWALRAPQPPAPLPASAPASQFSATRAAADMAWLAQKPRPIASAASSEARAWIVQRLQSLGLAPQLQTSTEMTSYVDHFENASVTVAGIHNIVVRRPGVAADHASRPALLLAVHYDTTANSVGAGEVGAPVAAVLETLRALPPLQNDVIVLFADGHHTMALGAAAFADKHPWARQVGLVLQFEALGRHGPLVLYDTHGDSGAAVAGWAQVAPLPLGSSLMHSVRKFASTTALTRVGAAGLAFTTIAGAPDDIGSLDTPDRFDRATLQHLGATMLAVTTHFGNAKLADIARVDQIYFTLPLVGIVHYPSSWIWPTTRVLCLLCVGVFFLALQRQRVQPREVVKGALAYALIGALMAFSAYVLWLWAPMLHASYNPHVDGSGNHDQWYLPGYIALCTALFVYLQRRVQEVIGAATAALGALVALTLALVVASIVLPGASYLLTWPLFGILSAHAALMIWPVAANHRIAILLAGLAPALLLIVPALRDVYNLVTPERMNMPIVLLAMLLGCATTLVASMQRRFVVRTLILACVAMMTVARSAPPAPAERPQPNGLTYLKDAYSWRAYWVLPASDIGAWNRHYFPDAIAPRRLVEAYRYRQPAVWIAPAPRTPVQFPYIVMLADDDGDAVRRIEFTVTSKNLAPTVSVHIEGAHPRRTYLNGHELTHTENLEWVTRVHGMGDTPLHFVMEIQPDKPFRIVVQETIPGLPAQAPLMLAGGAPPLTPLTETTVASDTLIFR